MYEAGFENLLSSMLETHKKVNPLCESTTTRKRDIGWLLFSCKEFSSNIR